MGLQLLNIEIEVNTMVKLKMVNDKDLVYYNLKMVQSLSASGKIMKLKAQLSG